MATEGRTIGGRCQADANDCRCAGWLQCAPVLTAAALESSAVGQRVDGQSKSQTVTVHLARTTALWRQVRT